MANPRNNAVNTAPNTLQPTASVWSFRLPRFAALVPAVVVYGVVAVSLSITVIGMNSGYATAGILLLSPLTFLVGGVSAAVILYFLLRRFRMVIFVALALLVIVPPIVVFSIQQKNIQSKYQTNQPVPFGYYLPSNLPAGYHLRVEPKLMHNDPDKYFSKSYNIEYTKTQTVVNIKEFAATERYNPPADCGDDSAYKTDYVQACTLLDTSPPDQPIYAAAKSSGSDQHILYTHKGDTVITAEWFDGAFDITEAEVVQILSSLQAADAKEIRGVAPGPLLQFRMRSK